MESAIKYFKNNFVNGRKFTDSHNLKTQLKDWVEKANLRVHGTTKKVPYLVFKDKEQDRLQPLPNEDFTYFNRAIRKVGRNCHINFQQNYYSVPDSLVGKEVTIRWNEYLLRVVYQGEQVALHKLNSSYGEHITVRAHMPSYKIYSQTEYQASYEDKMASIGSSAHKLFFLLVKRNNYWGRTVRGVLGLAQEYGKKKVEASITRALHFNSTELTTLKNIITNRLYLLELEPRLPKSEDSSLSRDLSYYTVE